MEVILTFSVVYKVYLSHGNASNDDLQSRLTNFHSSLERLMFSTKLWKNIDFARRHCWGAGRRAAAAAGGGLMASVCYWRRFIVGWVTRNRRNIHAARECQCALACRPQCRRRKAANISVTTDGLTGGTPTFGQPRKTNRPRTQHSLYCPALAGNPTIAGRDYCLNNSRFGCNCCIKGGSLRLTFRLGAARDSANDDVYDRPTSTKLDISAIWAEKCT